MQRSVMVIGCVLIGTAAQAGDKPLFSAVPAWVTPAPPIDPAKINGDAPALLLVDNQQKLQDGQVWSYVDTATRAATPQVLGAIGTIKISWQPAHGDLIVHRAEIIRGTQHIDLLKDGKAFSVIRREQGLEHWALDGVLTATMPVEGLSVGDVLHVTYSTTTLDPTLKGRMQAIAPLLVNPTRVEFARVRLLWPEASKVQWKAYVAGLSTQTAHAGGMEELTVTLPAPKQPDMPKDAPLRFQHVPIVEASSFASWSDLAAIMAPLYATDGLIKPGSPLAAEVARIVAADPDPLHRAAMALQSVQEKVRYQLMGMETGNYVPQPPEQTWAMRYGDCKAKTLLLLAMLHAMNIEAEPVLANTKLGGIVAERLPSAAAFNHVLVHATINGESLWLDGTKSGDRLTDIRDTPPFWSVLPVRASGSTLLPIVPHAPERPDILADMQIDERAGVNLPAPFQIRITVHGGTAGALRAMNAQAGKDDITKIAEAAIKPFLNDALLVTRQISFDDSAGTATVDATGLTNPGWDKRSERWGSPLNRGFGDVAFSPDRARPAWKDLPVLTGSPRHVQTTTRVKLPAGGGFTLEGDQPVAIAASGMKLSRTVTRTDDEVVVAADMQASGAEIPAADLPAVRKALAPLTVRPLRAVAPASYPPAWQVVQDARKAHRLDPILAAFQQRIADKPDDAGRYVARAVFLERTFDRKQALADYDHAIAIAPDAATYLARANVHEALGERSKAIADATAARQLDPASDAALARLAKLTADGGDRPAALALLQERIDAGGNNKNDLVAMKAEIQAEGGDKDGAVATLDAAIADNPGEPDLLNSRCWVKGTGGFGLDAALKDCTKSIELSDSPEEALDSRAMVYFRMNRYDDALADLQAVLTRDPDLASSIYLRGVIRKRTGDTKAAETDIAAARMLRPQVDEDFKRYGITP